MKSHEVKNPKDKRKKFSLQVYFFQHQGSEKEKCKADQLAHEEASCCWWAKPKKKKVPEPRVTRSQLRTNEEIEAALDRGEETFFKRGRSSPQ